MLKPRVFLHYLIKLLSKSKSRLVPKLAKIKGNIKETLKLSERIYHCECCGLEIDRDYNASINILRKGLEILKEEKVS